VLRRYGFGFVARGRRERVFDFTFFFFRKIRHSVKLLFSLLERENKGKGTLLLLSSSSLSGAGGCSGEGSETIKRAKKDFPRCLFPRSSGVWMRIALKPLKRLDVLRALDGIAAGAIFSISRFWIWTKIFFFCGRDEDQKRNQSLASSSRATHADTSSLSFTLHTHTHTVWWEIYIINSHAIVIARTVRGRSLEGNL